MRSLPILLLLSSMCLQGALEISVFSDPLSSNYSPLLRPVAEEQPSISCEALCGEAVFASLLLYNAGVETAYVQVQASGRLSTHLTLREAAHIRASFGQLPADILPEISADGVVVIPAGENRQLFLDFNTRNLEAGNYEVVVQCNDLDSRQALSCSIKLRLSTAPPLPERHPLSVLVWDCSLAGSSGKLAENIRRELTDNYVNTFHVLERAPAVFNDQGEIVKPPDFSQLGARLDLLQPYGLMMLRCSAPNLRTNAGKKLNVKTEVGAKAYGEWTKIVVQYLKNRNMNYEDFYFYIFDEDLRDEFFAAAKAVKAADPNVRVYADPCGSTKASEVSRAFEANCVDYLQYHAGWFKNMPAELEAASREKLSVFSTYWCPVHQKRLSPANFYRQMGAFAFKHRLSGVGYWTALGLANDVWGVPLDDFRKSASSVAIYPAGDYTVMPSRRWKGFRAGLDDYLYFQALQQRPASEVKSRLLDQVEEMAGNKLNAQETANLRRHIIKLLEEK